MGKKELKPPCQNCAERHIGCHPECEKYKVWRDAYHKHKKIVTAEMDKERTQDSFVIESWAAARRKKYQKPRKKV